MHRNRAQLRFAASLGLALVALATPARAETAPEAWQFEVTPYIFGAGLRGTTGVGPVTADIDASFGDILKHFDSGFMAAAEARKGPWAFAFDGVYFRLKDQATRSWQGPGGIGSADWWDPVVGFRVMLPFAEHWTFMGYGDVGGFGVGSKITYQAIAGANWEFAKSFTAKFGYRYMYQKYDKNNFLWDMAAHGFYAGSGIAF